MNEQALKDRLQTIRKEKGISFNECWKQLLLERFLSRLARSSHSQQFIFKGGFLLSYFLPIGRETSDLDFLLTRMDVSSETIIAVVEEIINIGSEDGFLFSYDGIELLEQPHMNYAGYRVHLNADFGRMKDKIHVDVGIGDVVLPITRGLPLFQYKGKSLFENEISLMVYPPETIFAEKLETVLSKGSTNSRMKDFHDLFLLAHTPSIIDLDRLRESIKNTFRNRGTVLESIRFNDGEITSMQQLWGRHIGSLRNPEELGLPTALQDVILEINRVVEKIPT